MAKALNELIDNSDEMKAGRVSFGDALREELVEYYGIPEEYVEDEHIDKNKIIIDLGQYTHRPQMPELWLTLGIIHATQDFYLPITLRELYITHGTRIRRAQDPLYWIKKITEKINALEDQVDLIINDDPRTASDFEYLLNYDTDIYHLKNGCSNISDISQDAMNKWLTDNPQHITKQIDVPLPLSQEDAKWINWEQVIGNDDLLKSILVMNNA